MLPRASHAILVAEKVVTRAAKREPVRNRLWPIAGKRVILFRAQLR